MLTNGLMDLKFWTCFPEVCGFEIWTCFLEVQWIDFGHASQRSDGLILDVLDVLPRGPLKLNLDVLPRGPMV